MASSSSSFFNRFAHWFFVDYHSFFLFFFLQQICTLVFCGLS
jgi:hypothetical protein